MYKISQVFIGPYQYENLQIRLDIDKLIWVNLHLCSDPHFSEEGGTIYSTGFFLADRYIHRREM